MKNDKDRKSIINKRDTAHRNEVEDLQIPQKENLCRNLKGNSKSFCHQKPRK